MAMEFWLYNQANNQRQTLSLDGAALVVGRDEACDVVIKGPFIAKRHARLLRKGNQFFVENLSRSSLRVASRDVAPQQQVRVDFGDEIQIAQYSLAMIRPQEKQATAAADDRRELQRRLMDVEQQVHAELLDRMNLRATATLNKADANYVAQVMAHLEQVLTDKLAQLDPALVRHTVYSHLHRMVIAEVVRQCQGKVQTDYRLGKQRQADPRMEQQITEAVASMVDMMPLLFDPTSVSEDLAIAEEAFDDLFDQTIQTLPRTLQAYIVRQSLAKDIQDIMFGLGPLQDLLEMANVSEIMVVGKDNVYVEKNGVVQPTTRSFFSDEILLSVIERVLTPVGRRVDTSTPLVDARLPDGSRVNVVISPLSLVGPCLTIRKFSWIPFTMDDLVERGSINDRCAMFLQACVAGRKNIVISGGTGSGKTTLLNTLASFAHPGERIVTIEESAELQLTQPHVVRLESRPANIEGRGSFSIRDLLRNSLRMRPDRIIVGEVRGPEALDMLQAMNTGHDGSLSTLHANAPHEAMQRLETLVLMAVDMPVRAIREQVLSAIDLVVQITRFHNGPRRVTHISEVTQIEPDTGKVRVEDIFVLRDGNTKEPTLRPTGYVPSFAQELIRRDRMDVKVFL